VAFATVFTLVALSSGASASEPGGGGGTGGLPFTAIPGVLDAQGDGIAAAAGMLNMRLCADEGILLVKKGDATITGGSFTSEADWMGLHVYFGFHDCLYLTGGKTAALVVGTGLKLHAEGVGIAFLKGIGSYTIDGVTHDGATEGIVVQIGQRLFDTRPSRTPQTTRTPGTGDHREPTRTPTPGATQP
jgi:hypothetical protein